MPTMFRRTPTRPQAIMIVLMAVAFGALLLWLIPEFVGVFSEATEDTYSEWVWDLPLWAVIGLSVLQGIAGFALIASVWHYLEGWARRRRIERGAKRGHLPEDQT